MTLLFRSIVLFFMCAIAPLCSHNISVIGVGRLGLSYALTLAEAGHRVLGIDVHPGYIASLNEKTLDVG